MAGVGVQVAQEGLETYGGMDTKPRKVLAPFRLLKSLTGKLRSVKQRRSPVASLTNGMLEVDVEEYDGYGCAKMPAPSLAQCSPCTNTWVASLAFCRASHVNLSTEKTYCVQNTRFQWIIWEVYCLLEGGHPCRLMTSTPWMDWTLVLSSQSEEAFEFYSTY
jgi:hypothetical protein